MRTAHVFIEGKVQGVFFRDSIKRKADALGVKGWVKNLDDGRVEAVLSGSEENVKEMVRFCRQGPPAAEVTDVDVSYEESAEFASFKVRY
ncbi:acylphosphatase [Candidatus Woesearchaeota archaeon]|nr:acylphosphatase [Candidatus Woesearchaeota archaeon]